MILTVLINLVLQALWGNPVLELIQSVSKLTRVGANPHILNVGSAALVHAGGAASLTDHDPRGSSSRVDLKRSRVKTSEIT